jgi:hypothetical protein
MSASRSNLACLVLSLSLPLTALAGDGLVDRVRACAGELNDAKRLACYDREIGRTEPGGNADLGVTDEMLRQERRQAGLKAATARNVTGQVVAITRSPDGKFTVTLDNGQRWAQQEVLDFPVQAGDIVSVRRGALGVIWMTNGTRPIETRVHRVN